MTDSFSSYQAGLDSPATHVEPISPGTTLTKVSRAIYVGGAGNIAVTMTDGSTCNFTAVPAGTILPIRTGEINSGGGTTATNMVAIS